MLILLSFDHVALKVAFFCRLNSSSFLNRYFFYCSGLLLNSLHVKFFVQNCNLTSHTFHVIAIYMPLAQFYFT